MATKTEHNGAKHGCGAYWGRKADAKQRSNSVRRANDRKAILALQLHDAVREHEILYGDGTGRKTGLL